MNNQELIKTLNYDDLLSIVELLSIGLRNSNNDLDDLDELDSLYIGWLSDEVFEYVKGLTDYQRLKLMQLIINTLIHESEQSAAQSFQISLPLEIKG